MLALKDYGSSDDNSDPEIENKRSEVNLTRNVDSDDTYVIDSLPVKKLVASINMQVCAAPDVIPTGTELCVKHIDSTVQEVTHNPKYEELFAPDIGPENPFKTQQQRAVKNMLSGYVEKAHISEFQFENQRRTFASYGYALDPTVDGSAEEGRTIIGAKEAAEESGGKTVFENTTLRPSDKRKRHRNDDPADIEGFLGPWGGYVDEKRIIKPTEEEAAKLEEILAKRNRRGKATEEKPLEEKTVLHIKDSVDYQGRSFLHAPQDVGVNLRSESPPDRCFLPKAQIHTWEGHTKGISQIRWFPRTAHLLLSCSMDCRVKLWEVYKDRRCIRTYYGHRQAVRDISFDNDGKRFLSAGYDRYVKLWDTETGACISRFTSRKIPYCVKFNPDPDKQHLFVAGTSDKKIICWDVRSGEVTQEYDRHLGAVNTITFVDENRRFVTTSDDKSLRVWEWDIPVDMKYIADPSMHSMPAVTPSPNQKWLACQSMDNKIVIFSALNRFKMNRKKTFTGHMVAGYACGLDFSPDMRFNVKMEGPSLGYSYHLPSAGWNLRVRNVLSQFSDLFSEFNKYIAPAYHHDRCERSVQMRLYSMHKREFVMVFVAFFACFGLSVFIGLAGPVTSMTEPRVHLNGSEVATGPFIMKTPLLSTYSQQLWVIAKLLTSNNDDERYDKSFQISISIDAIAIDHKLVPVLSSETGHNRTRHLKCERQTCEELVVAHLGFLDYSYYIITVRFHGLESFHQRYDIRELIFYFKNYNPAFTEFEIWFRFIFLLTAFGVMCWFGHSLRKYPLHDWSIEQKWISILLPLLILYNNPLFPMTFLVNSWVPGMVDAILQTTFLCAVLMFWLCVYHGLRQNERRLITFYLPKVLVVGLLWCSALILATWLRCTELEDPTYNYVLDTSNYFGFKVFFFTVGGFYIAYLLLLILRAYSELRCMPYFDLRLRFLTLLAGVVSLVCGCVTARQFGAGIFEDSFASRLTTYYRSSAQFMALYGLLNFYLYTMAYVYAPAYQQVYGQHSSITKDNPTFSMINDSDEDVIYGSDEEVVYGSDEDSRRPLTRATRTANSNN